MDLSFCALFCIDETKDPQSIDIDPQGMDMDTCLGDTVIEDEPEQEDTIQNIQQQRDNVKQHFSF